MYYKEAENKSQSRYVDERKSLNMPVRSDILYEKSMSDQKFFDIMLITVYYFRYHIRGIGGSVW